jgi:multidrug efflux pump subunit AcrA (membrane-fusion protein)
MRQLIREILLPSPELELAGNVSQIVRLGLVLLVVFFGVGGGWIAFVPMSSAITSSGVVKVLNDAQIIQHHNGGIVKRIFVNDGDRAHKGQPLLEFEDASR